MEVHDKQLFHAGYRKTFHKACHSSIVTVIEIISVFLYKLIQMQSMYCGIPRNVVLEGLHNVSAAQTTTSFSSIETNPCFGIHESITGIYCPLLIALSYVQLHL